MSVATPDLRSSVVHCSWFIDSEVPCGAEATIRFNLALCEAHWPAYRNSALGVDSAIKQSLNYYPLDSFPGYCYFLLLPNGRAKVGYSNTPELVIQRFKDLTRELGPLVPLAVIRGGFVAERYYHDKFRAYRDYSSGAEQFTWSPEIAETVSQLGICHEVAQLLSR